MLLPPADILGDAWVRSRHAAELILSHAASVEVQWLLAGAALHMLAQVVRTRAWWHILRASYPKARGLRARDVTAAYLAGAGLNGFLPARGGDVVKLAWIHRRVPGSSYATLATTFVPETLFETVCGAALVVWALLRGFVPVPATPGELPSPDVSLYIEHPVPALAVTAVVVVGAWILVRWLRRRSTDLGQRMRRGLAIFRTPREYLTDVVSWQALSRVIRLGSLACFLAAFDLPVSLGTAMLVMAAQGGGRIIPIAPVSAGLRMAMVTYGLVEITGQSIDPAEITAFTFGVGAVMFAVMLVTSLVLIARELHTLSPRTALRRAGDEVGRAPEAAETPPHGARARRRDRRARAASSAAPHGR
jgi:Lysylphosphatidylglycerol synthase TM region